MRLAVPSTSESKVRAGFRRERNGPEPFSSELALLVSRRNNGLCLSNGLRRNVPFNNTFALSKRQLQRNGLAVQAFQNGGDATRILRADPVELEAVGNQQGDLGQVRCNTWAVSGLIQVLNCISGSSCASWHHAGLPQTLAASGRARRGRYGKVHSRSLKGNSSCG